MSAQISRVKKRNTGDYDDEDGPEVSEEPEVDGKKMKLELSGLNFFGGHSPLQRYKFRRYRSIWWNRKQNLLFILVLKSIL